MPTTTLNSKSLRQRGASRSYKWFFLLLSGAFLWSGCGTTTKATPESFFELAPEVAHNRAVQSRTFETSKEMDLLSASAAVLQDLGFQIEESAPDLGILRGVKERGAREYGQEIAQAMILILVAIFAQDTFMVPVDMHQQIAATLATRPVAGDPSSYTVRIVFYRTIWLGHGEIGNTHISPGGRTMEMIYDPAIYQQFFAKLSKSVFLEAHQI